VAPPPISVCIVCRNEAAKLDACLRSVQWADEIVVMDLGSSDDSADVARRNGARVLVHDPVPIVELVRNEVAAAATHEWILAMDPDERAAPGLENELRAIAAREGVDAVAIPVMNSDFGYFATSPLHRYDPKPRFYRRDRVSWPTEPNELPTLSEGALVELPQRDDVVLIHERNQTIPEALERAIRYAPAEAQALLDSGETFTARKMLLRIARKAHKQYIQARAFDDGVPGIVRATVLVTFHFYVWACFWQLSGAKRTPEDDRVVRNAGRLVEGAWNAARVGRAPLHAVRRAKRALGRHG
jgi:glycosyltransferase involved in cell wall biosynthesis